VRPSELLGVSRIVFDQEYLDSSEFMALSLAVV
jgi:hypothetical protein